jgi:hypothetical protein
MTVLVVILKAKKIVAYFNHSTIACATLKKELKLRQKEYSSLIQAVITRWNSTFLLLERFYDALDAIHSALFRLKHKLTLLTPEEISMIPDIIALLQPFAALNDVFSSVNKPTTSLVIPSVKNLVLSMDKLQPLTAPGKEFKLKLEEGIKSTLLPYEVRNLTR